MAADPSADERRWSADKRDFVADSRDDAADDRDTDADTRESGSDAWEAALDAWEDALRARAEALGPTAAEISATERDSGRAARQLAREQREQARQERDRRKGQREEATARRLADSPTLLALAFADIAQHLYDADDYDEVLLRIAEAAVATVAGGQSASVTLMENGEYRTAVATADAATVVDRAQYDAGEGPSLDALTTSLVDAPAFPDTRWPRLGARPTEHGVHSSLSYRLSVSAAQPGDRGSSLSIYGGTPAAFDQEAAQIGLVLASHASLAARAVGERATLQGLGQQLEHALLSRDVIGQAKGILMERLKTTPEEAFDILRATSQRLNLKLREVARRLTETGEVADEDLGTR